MSDRIDRLTVSLRPDMRDDDAECVIQAIRMVKGVIDVSDHVADPDLHVAKCQVRHELYEKLHAALEEVLP